MWVKFKADTLYKSCLIFLLIILCYNIFSNNFEIILPPWFATWQQDSDQIVLNKIASVRTGSSSVFGLMGSYTQQIGLQSMFFTLADKLIGGDYIRIKALFLINAIMRSPQPHCFLS